MLPEACSRALRNVCPLALLNGLPLLFADSRLQLHFPSRRAITLVAL